MLSQFHVFLCCWSPSGLSTLLLRPCRPIRHLSSMFVDCLLLWAVHRCAWRMLLCQLRERTPCPRSPTARRSGNGRHCWCLSSNVFTALLFQSAVRRHLRICRWGSPPLPADSGTNGIFLITNAAPSTLTDGGQTDVLEVCAGAVCRGWWWMALCSWRRATAGMCRGSNEPMGKKGKGRLYRPSARSWAPTRITCWSAFGFYVTMNSSCLRLANIFGLYNPSRHKRDESRRPGGKSGPTPCRVPVFWSSIVSYSPQNPSLMCAPPVTLLLSTHQPRPLPGLQCDSSHRRCWPRPRGVAWYWCNTTLPPTVPKPATRVQDLSGWSVKFEGMWACWVYWENQMCHKTAVIWKFLGSPHINIKVFHMSFRLRLSFYLLVHLLFYGIKLWEQLVLL